MTRVTSEHAAAVFLSAFVLAGCAPQSPPAPQPPPQFVIDTKTPPPAGPYAPTGAASTPCVPAAELRVPPRQVHHQPPSPSSLSNIVTHGGVLIYNVTIGPAGNVTSARLVQRRGGQRPS